MKEDDYVFYSLDSEIKRVQKDRVLRNKKLVPRDFKDSKIFKYSLIIALFLNILFGGFGFFLFSVVICTFLFLLDVCIDYNYIKENVQIDKRETRDDMIDPEKYYYEEFLYLTFEQAP